MDDILERVEGIFCYLDDVMIFGTDREECTNRVKKSIIHFSKKYNVKVRLDKSIFLQPEITYLGFQISGNGIRVLEDELKPILESPEPTNVLQ